MRNRTVATALAAIASALLVPAVHAQRPTFVAVNPRPQGPRAEVPRVIVPTTPLPSSPILPMRNPIAPMTTSPVLPIIPSPFIRYGGTPTVVIPGTSVGATSPQPYVRPRQGRDVPYVPYVVPYAAYNPGVVVYPAEPVREVTVPGQLPSLSYGQSWNRTPGPVVAVPTTSTFVYIPQPTYESEPRYIITEPRPDRVVVRPAIGISRTDLLRNWGQPWGSFKARGAETLYFDGGLIVILAGDRVTEVR